MDGKYFSYNSLSQNQICFNTPWKGLDMLNPTAKCGLELEEIYPKLDIKKENSSKWLSSSLPLYVVQMDPKFVTKLTSSEIRNEDSYCVQNSQKSRPRKKFASVFNPYYCSQRKLRQLKREEYVPQKFSEEILITPAENPLVNFTEKNTSSLLIVPHQDCGRKSNPSSPVKSQNSLTPAGCSIFRSRSLDDLEITSKLNLDENGHNLICHSDIDTVSQSISKLHVS